jgi:hypothetical protein
MNQRTHAWIAIRALKLLDDIGQVSDLVSILKPFTQEAAIGAWIPDERDAKLGGSKTQNHVFKIGVYKGSLKARFVLEKKKLLGLLGKERKMSGFLDKYSSILDDHWWAQPYKASPPPGAHLANRAMALTINNVDMLMLGDDSVQNLVPGTFRFINQVSKDTRCTSGQIALFFFMLSHFIADSLMPCHCDDRDLSDYSNGLHKELEDHWSKKVGNYFDKSNLCQSGMDCDKILNESITVDDKFGIKFSHNSIPKIKSDDIWEEIVLLCRGSFGVASIIANPQDFPYKPKNQVLAPFNTLFSTQDRLSLLSEVDNIVMHDSVLNVAMIWKYIWQKFK